MINTPVRLSADNFTHQMWGGDWIARLKGMTAPSSEAIGEAWEFSGRADRPSRVWFADGTSKSLPDLIKENPSAVLGERVVKKFGMEAPILIKFIDARDDLSLQVHPSDDYARRVERDSGKSESWLILDTGTGANDGYIYLGFNPAKASDYASPDEFSEAFLNALREANAQGPSEDPNVRARAERLILPFLNRIRVKAGEVYELVPGTVHSIGRGVRLFEIQQASNVTYRVWDWNRIDAAKLAEEGKKMFRELHVDKAKDVLNFKPADPASFMKRTSPVAARGSGQFSEEELLVEFERRFAAHRIRLNAAGSTVDVPTDGVFQVLSVLDGRVSVGDVEAGRGETILIPASMPSAVVKAVSGRAEVVRSYVPV